MMINIMCVNLYPADLYDQITLMTNPTISH